LGENETEAVRVKNNVNGLEEVIPVKGFFVAIGHQPNTSIFEKWLSMDSSGYLIAQQGSTKTDIPGVFVSGDAADKVYRQAITAAGTGCMAALDAERYLVEHGIS
jgi:thioredoxin reductase (NADPH)